MTQKTRVYTLGAIVIIAASVALYVVLHPRTALAPRNSTTGTSSAVQFNSTLSASSSSQGTKVRGSAATTLRVGAVAAPSDYAKPLVYPSSITADQKALIEKQFAADVAAIKASDDLDAWANLASLRGIVDDYRGQAAIFQYLAAKMPSSAGPFASLGFIYGSYLHDFAKADANYLKAISLNPKLIDVYVSLSQMYRAQYPKTNTAPEDILRQGLKANPDAYQLQIELARYFASTGRTADAKAAYQAAIDNANRQKLSDIAAQIQIEANTLR